MKIGRILFPLLLALGGSAWGQVQSVAIGKGFGYIQTGSSTVVVDPRAFNYAFIPTVDGVNLSGITPPFMTGPYNPALSQSNGGVFVFNSADNGWRYGAGGAGWATPTLADLDAAFPNGTYTITVNGNAIPLTLTGDAYPNAPIMSFSGAGAWANGQYVADPAQAVTVTTNAFTSYGTHVEDTICVLALVPGYTLPFQSVGPYGCGWAQARQLASQTPAVKTLSYTIPANTMVAGQTYSVQTFFAATVDSRPVAGLPGSTNAAFYYVRTKATVKAQAPPFPLTVNANITPTVSTVTASMQFQPQDVGTTGSVYSFFVAPKTKVVNAATMEKGALLGGMKAKSAEKAVAVECVLAQLNQSGQLQGVSAANLQAYVTGVLQNQGQVVSMVNNLPTANIAGTTLYIGYANGADPLAMISKGTNRRAAKVPGEIQCDPQAPDTGWWWNKAEGGRGYSIEVAGNHLFYAAYLYDTDGRATWYVASGPVWLDNSVFPGNLEAYSGGQALSGAYKAPAPAVLSGPITLAFTDAQTGTMTWPGGTVALERFNIVVDGLKLAPQASQPESGWWWNPSESGRGYFLEWQGGELFMAGYMYDDDGNSIWYLSSNTTPSTNLQSYTNTWWQYAGGQTLTGPFKPATQISNNVGPVSIQFTGTDTAVMTLPGGRTTNIRRFRF